MSFQLRFKDLKRVRLSDVSSKIKIIIIIIIIIREKGHDRKWMCSQLTSF